MSFTPIGATSASAAAQQALVFKYRKRVIEAITDLGVAAGSADVLNRLHPTGQADPKNSGAISRIGAPYAAAGSCSTRVMGGCAN